MYTIQVHPTGLTAKSSVVVDIIPYQFRCTVFAAFRRLFNHFWNISASDRTNRMQKYEVRILCRHLRNILYRPQMNKNQVTIVWYRYEDWTTTYCAI